MNPTLNKVLLTLTLAAASCLLLAGCGSPAVIPPPETADATTNITPVPSPTTSASETSSPSATLLPSPSPTPELVRFAVIGDYGLDGNAEAGVTALVLGWQPDLIVTTGDNNYPSGQAETIDANIGKYYHAYIFPYTGAYGTGAELNRFFPSLGNHDWYSRDAQPYFDYFQLPGNERYYDFAWGAVHFFILDSDEHEPDGINRASLQSEWLQAALQASASPWQVVIMHYPPFSSGTEGSTDWMQWHFAEWGADAVLAGHDHLYERLLVNGIPHFIVGTGGGGLYNFADPLPESQFRYNANYGALLVSASPAFMTFEFFSREGRLVDQYRILK